MDAFQEAYVPFGAVAECISWNVFNESARRMRALFYNFATAGVGGVVLGVRCNKVEQLFS